MALQADISFQVYEGGKMIRKVQASALVNTFDDLLPKLRTQVEKEFPSASDITIQFNQKFPAVGVWIIYASSNIDGKSFLLLISLI